MSQIMNIGGRYTNFCCEKTNLNKVGKSNKVGTGWQFPTNTGKKSLKTVVVSAEIRDNAILSFVHKDMVLFNAMLNKKTGNFIMIPNEGSGSKEYNSISKSLTSEYINDTCKQLISEGKKLRKLPTLLKMAVEKLKF